MNESITTIKPFLTVSNGRKAVEFYVKAFGAIEVKRFEMHDDKISSVLEIEKAIFYVADEEPDCENLSPDPKFRNPVWLILETKNADEFFDKAVKLGATKICPMTTESDWRIGKLRDPFGHIWEIGYTL